jgi:hypothetical protein
VWLYLIAWGIALPFAMFPYLFWELGILNDHKAFAVPLAMVAVTYLWDTTFTMKWNKSGGDKKTV